MTTYSNPPPQDSRQRSQRASCSVVAIGEYQPHAPMSYCINIYPEDNMIAAGFDHQYNNHGAISYFISQRTLGNQVLPLPPIGGWLTKSSVIVSFCEQAAAMDQILRDTPDQARELLGPVFSRCHRAIQLAHEIANDWSQPTQSEARRVRIWADDYQSKRLALALGLLHMADDFDGIRPEKLVKDSLAVIGDPRSEGSVRALYSKTTRVRYIPPAELLALLRCINEPISLFSNLSDLIKILEPDKEGYRHARFLVVDSAGKVLSDPDKVPSWCEKLKSIHNVVARLLCQPNNNRQHHEAKTEIIKLINELQKEISADCHPLFQRFELENPRFVEAASDIILRAHSDSIGLWPDVSIPLTALATGTVRPDTGELIPHPDADRDIIGIARWALANLTPPASSTAKPTRPDYVAVLAPESRPVAFDHFTPRTLHRIGYVPSAAFVVVVGCLEGAELRILLRNDPYSPISWGQRKTDTVQTLLARHSEQQLSSWCREFRTKQAEILRTITSYLPEQSVSFPQPYIAVERETSRGTSYNEFIPFIGTQRLDTVDMGGWSFEQFEALQGILGKLVAVTFLAQFSNISSSEIVIDEYKGASASLPHHITYLSSAGSFFHGLGQPEVKGYMQTACRLYGNVISSWVARALYNLARQSTSDPQLVDTSERLTAGCVDSMKRTLMILTRGQEQLGILRQISRFEDEYSDRRFSEVPDLLNMAKFLRLTRNLLTLTPERIETFCVAITKQVQSNLRLINTLVSERPDRSNADPNADVKYQCTEALCALLRNSLSEPKIVQNIERLLDDVPTTLSELSVEELSWYFALLDIGARMAAMRMDRIVAASIFRQALTIQDQRRLHVHLTNTFPMLNLTPSIVDGLHRAVAAFSQKLQAKELSANRRDQLNLALNSLYRFF